MATRKVRLSLAQRRANPALRSKLPTSALTPKQQSQRRINRRIARDNADPLLDPTTQLAGHQLQQAASQITEAGIKPKEMALSREMNSATAQGNALADRSAGYYRDLAEREAQAFARRQALQSALKGDLTRVGEGARTALDEASRTEEQRQQQDINRRGSGLEGTDNAMTELAAAKANSGLAQQTAENTAATQQTNWGEMMQALGQARQLRGAEVQGELQNRLANQQAGIRGQQAELASTRGDEYVKNLLGLRDTSFTNLATMEGLGIKKSDLQAQIEKAQGDQALAHQRIQSTARTNAANRKSREGIASAGLGVRKQSLAEQHRHNVVQENKPPRGTKPTAEPQSAVQLKRAVNNLSGEIREAVRTGKVPGADDLTMRRAAAALISDRAKRAKQPAPPQDVLSAAIDLVLDGHVSRRNRAILREAKVQIPASWMPKQARRPRTAATKAPH